MSIKKPLQLLYLNYKFSLRNFSNEIVRVRFAPSPTGFLHLGGLRTALYNYLFAKSRKGVFILRIEDTDQKRTVDGAVEQLQLDLKWLSIVIDEGPYLQSERSSLYKEQVEVLLNKNIAYKCFCSDRRLDLLRREAMKNREVPKYDNRCRFLTKDEIARRLDKNETYCIRFKLTEGAQTFQDLVFGPITHDVTKTEGDPVIMKSDGYPTYHFANIVDDHFMQITHVLRGVEWQVSTPKHIMLYNAFNWTPPLYGHLPLLLNQDGSKLSKRQGDIKIAHYRENGILPHGLLNFIAHSSSGFINDLEAGVSPKAHTIADLIQKFDLNKIDCNSSRIMHERLMDFNKLEIRRQLRDPTSKQKIINDVRNLVLDTFDDTSNLAITDEEISTIIDLTSYRIKSLKDYVSNDYLFLWVMPTASSIKIDPEDVISLKKLCIVLDEVENFEKDHLKVVLRQFAEVNGIDFGKIMKSLRNILSGLEEGPSIAEMMQILGKENTKFRILNFIDNNKYIRK